MSTPSLTVSADCPGCGYSFPIEELLAHFEDDRAVTRFAEGSRDAAYSTLTQKCHRCMGSVTLTFRRVASKIIDRQTQDLFASISQTLRGKSKLH